MRDFKGSADVFTTAENIGFSGVPWPCFRYKHQILRLFMNEFINFCLVLTQILLYFLCFPRWGGGKGDKYFARLGKNIISVYETDSFSLIDKKSLKIENVVDFCWSPTDPMVALFVSEMGGGNHPARVSKYML